MTLVLKRSKNTLPPLNGETRDLQNGNFTHDAEQVTTAEHQAADSPARPLGNGNEEKLMT